MSEEALLRAEGIHKTYDKNGAAVQVLRGVDFQLMEGETVAILGSSGAGKSTLLHVLGTLETPTTGKIFYRGQGVEHSQISESGNLLCFPISLSAAGIYCLGKRFDACANCR